MAKLLVFESKAQRQQREGMERFLAWKRKTHEHNQRLLAEERAATKSDGKLEPPTGRPEEGMFFANVVRALEPHPLSRIIEAIPRIVDGVFGVLRPLLSVYLLVVTTVAMPFAILARMWWLAAYCALMAVVFAWILLAQVREWPWAAGTAGRVFRWLRQPTESADVEPQNAALR